MIHWMKADVPSLHPSGANFRVLAQCGACQERYEELLRCETGATTSAVRALEKKGWLAFDVDLRFHRRLKTVGICPDCVKTVPWLRRAVGQGDEP